MRAYAAVLQPPAGPVYVSIPLDDWDQPALGEATLRSVSSRYSPDPDRVASFAERIGRSKNPVLIYGPEIERAGGWDAGIKFAERLKAPVYLSSLCDRAPFPHTQFRGRCWNPSLGNWDVLRSASLMNDHGYAAHEVREDVRAKKESVYQSPATATVIRTEANSSAFLHGADSYDR